MTTTQSVSIIRKTDCYEKYVYFEVVKCFHESGVRSNIFEDEECLMRKFEATNVLCILHTMLIAV